MDDLSAKTREICKMLEITPTRSKGQNFLINEKIYDEIVAAAELKSDETVLEVGPGLGFLTMKLAKQVKKVVAVELDDQLANYLQMGIDAAGIDNVTIVNEDILRFNLDSYFTSDQTAYKIVANLPYNITSIFLRRFLTATHKPQSLVLMLQQEVAERIVATPPDMSMLAVSVQYYAAAKIIRIVKAGNFWPEPEVDSAIIKLEIRPQAYEASTDKRFFRVVKFGFSAKRKMLKNNLAAGLHLEPQIIDDILLKQGFNPKIRAENLSLQDWQKLFAALEPFVI